MDVVPLRRGRRFKPHEASGQSPLIRSKQKHPISKGAFDLFRVRTSVNEYHLVEYDVIDFQASQNRSGFARCRTVLTVGRLRVPR